MKRAIKEHRIERVTVIDDKMYEAVAASIDTDGKVMSYTYQIHPRPIDLLKAVSDILINGFLFGVALSLSLYLLGAFLA